MNNTIYANYGFVLTNKSGKVVVASLPIYPTTIMAAQKADKLANMWSKSPKLKNQIFCLEITSNVPVPSKPRHQPVYH